MAHVSRDSTSRLLTAVRESQDASLRLTDPHEHARVRARLLQAVDQVEAKARPIRTAPARAGGWRWGVGMVAAAACAMAVVFAWPEPTLEFQIDGTRGATDAVIVAGQFTRNFEFSDSTTIALAPGGRVMIDELRSNGASVVLEQGTVELSVHHEHDTSWQVHAGPYEVHVTGTQFSVAWEPSTEHFEVEVDEGSVRVDGPEGELAKLRAGESLVRERGKATIEPENLHDEAPDTIEQPELERPSAARTDELEPTADTAIEIDTIVGDTAEPDDTSERHAGGGVEQIGERPVVDPSWISFFDDADYAGAWQLLSERPSGIIGEAKQADQKTLLDLADVARFTKHRDDARAILELLRERFPGSDEAGEAAFTLGRLAADSGSQAKAASYFELYLTERPNGPLVGDALGRLMDCYTALDQSADAQSTAESYLARFPNGPHAGKARTILDE